MSTEELQARLEYVEAILAAQTALLAPHLRTLSSSAAASPVAADILPRHPNATARTDLDALKSFYDRQSVSLMAQVGGPDVDITQLPTTGSTTQVSPTSSPSPSAKIDPGGCQTHSSPEPSSKRARYSAALASYAEGQEASRGFPQSPGAYELLEPQEPRLNRPKGGELVPPELMNFLIEIYFSRVHPFLPALHQPTFFSALSAYQNATGGVVGTLSTNTATCSTAPTRLRPILNAIVAATIVFIDEDWKGGRYPTAAAFIKNSAQKKELTTAACENVVMDAIENPSFEALQALLIVVVTSIGQGTPPFSWNLAGLLSRMSVQLGINREMTPNAPQPPMEQFHHPFQPFVLPANFLSQPRDLIEAEHRRRVFWSIFMVDRICAAGTGWSVALNRRDFSIDLPCSDYLWHNGIPAPGEQPSAKSAFQWGPDTSVREESDSPRLTLWKGHQGATPHTQGSPFRIATSPSTNTTAVMNIVGPTTYLCEAYEGLSQVLAFIQKPDNEDNFETRLTHLGDLDASLNAWKDSLPEEAHHVQQFDMLGMGTLSPINSMIHAVSIATTILLHQTFAYTAAGTDGRALATSSSLQGLDHQSSLGTRDGSRRACNLATEAMDSLLGTIANEMHNMDPFMAFFIFVSGRVRLVDIADGGEGRTSRAALSSHLKALRALGSVWGLGNYFADALELGCTFMEARSSDLVPTGSALGLFDLRIPAFSSGIFLASPDAPSPITAGL